MREIRMLRTTRRKLETELRDGLRHRKMAKASGQLRLPAPVATAPAFDPTGERRLEAGLWRGVRHRHCESRREQLPPSAYHHRASRRLYSITTQRPTKRLRKKTPDTQSSFRSSWQLTLDNRKGKAFVRIQAFTSFGRCSSR